MAGEGKVVYVGRIEGGWAGKRGIWKGTGVAGREEKGKEDNGSMGREEQVWAGEERAGRDR